MKNLDFEWITDEFMFYCLSTQLCDESAKSKRQASPIGVPAVFQQILVQMLYQRISLASRCRSKLPPSV